MIDWIRAHDVILTWLGAVSALMFVGSLLAIPWLIVRIPVDYFSRRRHLLADRLSPRHPALRIAVLILKNLVGVLLVLVGIIMILLPGQGILTILIGLILIDFPGKFALERWLVRRDSVLKGMNWIRRKAKHPPLESPHSVRDRTCPGGGDAH